MTLDDLIATLHALKERYTFPDDVKVYINDSHEGHSELEQVEFSIGGSLTSPLLRVILHSEDSE
jgi:hypothetical protein